MNSIYRRLQRCLLQVREKTAFTPDVALVLGSGLGGFAEEIKAEAVVGYADIDSFPVSTVPGHAGRFIFGTLDGVRVVAMQGRVHYYEGYPTSEVVLPVRLMHMLGARALLLTNAAGGINPDFAAGDLMLIRDHISVLVPNPLIGPNADELGTRFPDMSRVYDPALCEVVKSSAQKAEIPLREGVYIQFSGPSFETPAEIRMARAMGADAAGMSTACEAIAANHMGMRVCGISCISNKAAGLSPVPLTHAEVQAAADKCAPRFRRLVRDSLAGIAETL